MKFYLNYNFAFKVKKVTIDFNKIFKIYNVAIPLVYSVFRNGKYHKCTARAIFGPHLTKNALKNTPLLFQKRTST